MHSVKNVLCLDISKCSKGLYSNAKKRTFLALSWWISNSRFSAKNGTVSFDISSVLSTKPKMNVRGKVHKKLKRRFSFPSSDSEK